jgi:hypothetical protein
MRISKIEIILIALGFLGIGIFLAAFAGGPIYSDELSLMDAGLNNLKIPYSLNRYTHIFLQKPFLELASTPLIGAKIYWSFVLTSTGFLTYWCARILNRNNHIIHAALAAILFFSFHFFIDYSGVTIVDFTAMLMVMVFLLLYILAARNNFKRPWVIALGVIFFLAFKTKETTLIISVLLLGLGLEDGNKFSLHIFKKNLLYFFIGLLSGVFFFILLNTIILRDPLFGLSPTSIKAFLDSYVTVSLSKFAPNPQGWYTGALTTIWLLPFLLYVIAGVKAEGHFTPAIRLIWLVPISLVIFLTIMMFWRLYKVDLRFFFPSLPVICCLASQFFPFEMPAIRGIQLRFWLYLILIAIVSVGINYAVRPLAIHMSVDFDAFLNIIFYPLILSILILLGFLVNKYSYKTVLIPVACILSMTIYPIRTNIKYLAILHQNVAVVQQRFYPFSAFANQLSFTKDMRFYVSSSLHQKLAMLSTDKNELTSMYNVYFDSHAGSINFTISTSPAMIFQDLHQGSYTQVLLTLQDWQLTTTDTLNKTWLETHYSYFENPNMPVVLLVQK